MIPVEPEQMPKGAKAKYGSEIFQGFTLQYYAFGFLASIRGNQIPK